MKDVKIDSKREILYLKYKKSNIFDPSPYSTETNEHSKITDKITNRKYDKIFVPKIDNLTSRQRYIQNLYKIENNELACTPKKRVSKIRRKNLNYSANNSKINKKNYYNSINEKNYNNKNLSFYCESSINDKKSLKLLRTTTNHKIRSFYSKCSDIFNVNAPSPFKNDKNNRTVLLYNEKTNIDNISKTPDSTMKIKPLPINYKKIKNTKNYLQRELNARNNLIKSEGQKEEALRKKMKSKIFNRKKEAKKENIKNEILPPMYEFKLKLKNKKTNINNLESVNYNIINNKASKIRQEYTNLSSVKPSFGDISNYEILIPKNFNQVNEIKLKNILHSEGIHFFNFSEQGDIIGSNKGKYLFKVRNSNNEKEFNNKIKKINSKFSKINIKLNKIKVNHSKKKSDLIQIQNKNKGIYKKRK